MTVIRFRPSPPPRKQPKTQVRPRDYLSEREIGSMAGSTDAGPTWLNHSSDPSYPIEWAINT